MKSREFLRLFILLFRSDINVTVRYEKFRQLINEHIYARIALYYIVLSDILLVVEYFKKNRVDNVRDSAQIVSGIEEMSTKLLDLEIMSNQQIEAEMGERIRRRRLDMNISQTELARRAGVARRTITSVEHGEGCSLQTLIALVRALRALEWIDQFLPDPGISPMALLLQENEVKYRVKRRKHAGQPKKTVGEWKWGDEQ